MKTLIVASATIAFVLSASVNAASISGQGTWETTLQARDLDGNLATIEAYYDTILDITWLANANAGIGSSYDTEDTYADGAMPWANAMAWATSLDFDGDGLSDGWRLPNSVDVGNDGCSYNTSVFDGVDCGYNLTAHSEMSHMYYVTLGNKAHYDLSGNPQFPSGLTNTGPFSNLQPFYYWSATEYPDALFAWNFDFDWGGTEPTSKLFSTFAWAVYDGDVAVSAVPVPAAVWLFSGGLLGLIGLARHTKTA